MTVFEATATDHAGEPHPSELLELRFMSAEECATAPLASWMPIVLEAVFNSTVQFQPPATIATPPLT